MSPPLMEAEGIVPFSHHPLTPQCDDPSTCPWHSHTKSNFEANLAIVLILLLCALICALALNASIRCFLRHRSRHPPDLLPQIQPHRFNDRKRIQEIRGDMTVAATELVFSSEMRPKLAGTEADCAICLAEFLEGEGVMVLGECNHGFHLECIQKWLCSHSSCPTCRRSCISLPISSSKPQEHYPENDRHAAIA